MKPIHRIALLFVLLLIPAVATHAADFTLGVEGGRYLKDLGENYLGVQGTFRFGRWSVDPNIHYLLLRNEGGVHAGFASVDVDYHLATSSPTLAPWVGAGLGAFLVHYRDDSTSTTTASANAGVEWLRQGSVRPYVQARYVRALDDDFDGNTLSVGVGLRFGK